MAVIVTNAKNRVAYNVTRSLGRRGIPVYTCDFVPRSMAFFSRYSRGSFLYPSPFKSQEGFIASILENSRRLNADVLIPVFEETFLLAKYRAIIAEHVRVVLPAYDQILTAHNKDRWESLASKLNIPTPRTCTIDELRGGFVRADQLSYPVLIKPKQGGGAWAIAQVQTSDGLEEILARNSFERLPWHRFFVQEKIDGETLCVGMLLSHGKPRASIVYKQLRDYPVSGGQATLRVSVRHEAAEEYFQRLMADLEWHGVCQGDFVVDRNSGTPYLIDINPRLWGSLAQGIASGVDFPWLLYRMAVDGDVDPVNGFRENVMTRWIGGDLAAFIPALRRSQNRLSFIRDFMRPRPDIALYDDLSLEDPVPFFSWLADTLLRFLKSRSATPIAHDSLEGVWE